MEHETLNEKQVGAVRWLFQFAKNQMIAQKEIYTGLDITKLERAVQRNFPSQAEQIITSYSAAEMNQSRPTYWHTGSDTVGDGMHTNFTSFWKMLCYADDRSPVTSEKITIHYAEYLEITKTN